MQKNLFQTNFSRRKYQNLVNQINLLEDNLKTFSNSELCDKNFKLKKQYKDTKDLKFNNCRIICFNTRSKLTNIGFKTF